MDEMETKIRARIATLEEEIQNYVAQANATVAAYNASITELKRLVGEGDDETINVEDDIIEETEEAEEA